LALPRELSGSLAVSLLGDLSETCDRKGVRNVGDRSCVMIKNQQSASSRRTSFMERLMDAAVIDKVNNGFGNERNQSRRSFPFPYASLNARKMFTRLAIPRVLS
jgi:hypothetical protein